MLNLTLSKRNLHRGISLLETLVVISATTVICGVAVALLAVAFRTNDVNRERYISQNAVVRFAEQFRRDLKFAESIDISFDGSRIDLRRTEFSEIVRTISYVERHGSVTRNETSPNGTISDDDFHFGKAITVKFDSVKTDGGATLVGAKITSEDSARGMPTTSIVAAFGKFAKPIELISETKP